MKYLYIVCITFLFVATPWWIGLPAVLLGTLFIPRYIPYWLLLACGADLLFNPLGGMPIYAVSVGGMSILYLLISTHINFYEVV